MPWHSLERYGEEGLAVDSKEVELPPYYPDTPETREIWARYLSAVQVFDAKVGMVLEMLEEAGLLENAIVMVLTDHGRDMAGAKCYVRDPGIHVPLAIMAPEKHRPQEYEPGTISDQLVSGIDITPTMLAIAGVDVPDNLPGIPFLGTDGSDQREFAFAHRDRLMTHIDWSRAVIDGRYHYVRNYMPNQPAIEPLTLRADVQFAFDEMSPAMLKLRGEGELTDEQEQLLAEVRPAEELYDIESDPHQLKNLAEDPELLPVMRRMRTALELWIVETQDKGFLPEPTEAAIKGASIVPTWVQITKGKYDVEDFGIYDLPAAPEFAQLFQ